MSGIAEVMHNLGFIVSGSDLQLSSAVKSLKKMGIKVFSKHSSSNIKGKEVIVVSGLDEDRAGDDLVGEDHAGVGENHFLHATLDVKAVMSSSRSHTASRAS